MILRDLAINDFFCHANSKQKNPTRYCVRGSIEFNIQRGTATRKCLNLKSNVIENKVANLEVKLLNK